MITTTLLTIYILATLINLCFWYFIFARLAFHKSTEAPITTKNQAPVSIIICAKNEAENLQKNLSLILNQNYRSFEVIVVNDGSNDATAKVLLEFQEKNSYLRIIDLSNINKVHQGKKFALAKGIEAAKYELVLLTDADCCPTSPLWLAKMQQGIKDNIEIGLGYGPYYSKKSFLNKFIRFETVYTAIQYLSFALVGQAYMGVGRNLIYRKSLYFKVNGFTKHEHIASGDDDLFINEVANKRNVSVILNRETFMYSQPKISWQNFYRQKKRHLSTGTAYKPRHQALLGLLSCSHFLHYLIFFLFILEFSIIFVGIIYIARIITLTLWYKPILHKLDESDLLKWIPILDAFFVLYYLVFLPSLLIGKKNQWT